MMLESQRHRLIIDLLDEHKLVSVAMLTGTLKVSEATIRRDLVKLAKQGFINRVRGGAERLSRNEQNVNRPQLEGSPFLVNKEHRAYEKDLIAQKAVDICEDGESIIINGGSSTYMMAKYLRSRQLNILTNSFPLAVDLFEHSDNQITMPGGELYRKQKLILSPFENDSIKHYHGKMMFMGTAGLGDFGVMESDSLLIRAEQKLMAQADKLIILADSSKLGMRSNFILCSLEKVDVIITDSDANDKYIQLFEAEGIQVICVNTAKNA